MGEQFGMEGRIHTDGLGVVKGTVKFWTERAVLVMVEELEVWIPLSSSKIRRRGSSHYDIWVADWKRAEIEDAVREQRTLKEEIMKQISKFKPGDVVTTYHDPYTMKDPEGEAELVRFIQSHNDEIEFWEVQYVTDSHRNPVMRKIYIKDGDRA